MLTQSKVVVCTGSGGVGKTTMAAALGVRAAQLGRRVLVLTVDPAQRLATALGIELRSHHERKVELPPSIKGELSAAVINSKQVFDDFILTHAKPREVAEKIMQNRLYQQLSTTLSGSQEFTALERLLQAVESQHYDVVILDTPPTKHALDFLTAPDRINSLFQESVTRWFFASEGQSTGIIAGLVGRGTRAVLKSLETLTGAQFIEELIGFFVSVRSIQNVLRDRSQRAHNVLKSDATSFVVVTSFDAAKLMEAGNLQSQLKDLHYRLRAVIINRAYPTWLPKSLQAPPGFDAAVFAKVLNFFEDFQKSAQVRYNLYEEFARNLGSLPVVRVPEYQQDIYGLQDLTALATRLGVET